MSSKNYKDLSPQEKKQVLYNLYIKKELSISTIADQLGTYSNKIRRDAIKCGIPLRDKSNAQKIALQSGRHKHPTKGTTRDEDTKSKIGLSVLNNWQELSESERAKRQNVAKQNWEGLSEDDKKSRLTLANQAVRRASKEGSKLEKFILEHLVKDGIKVDFHKEQMLSNTRLQIDLFLPTINTAIEIDGPSHFKEVWGKNTLSRNIKYDNKKTGLILGKGLVLIRIKQSRDFSNSRGLLVYNKLLEKINSIKHNFPLPGDRDINIGDS